MRRAGVLIARARARRLRRRGLGCRGRRTAGDAQVVAGAAADLQRARAGGRPGRPPAGARAQRRRPTASACASSTRRAAACSSTSTPAKVLWRRLPDRVLPIASLTKMMTALLVVDRAPPDAKVRVTKEALAYKGSAVGVLPKGKRVKLETMLNGLLLPSGNDAAIALAQRMSGTVAALRAAHERARRRPRAGVHALQLARRLRGRGQPLVRDRPRRDGARRARPARAWRASSARRRAVLPVPDQGRADLPLQQQPAAAHRLPRHDRDQDRLHRRGRALPGGRRRRNGRRLGVVLLHSPDPGRQATQLLNRGFAAQS